MIWLLSCSKTPIVEKQENSTTIVIIGGGASGMATGKRLLELGLEPIILEATDTLGGSGIHAGRFFAVDSSWQYEHNIEDSIDLALSEWQNITGEEPDQAIQEFIQNSAQTLDWIAENGGYFENVVADYGAGSIPRIHTLSKDYPHPLHSWMTDLQPYTHFLETVESIQTTDDEIVIHTNQTTYSADILVIATGGFSRNPDLVSEFENGIDNFDWYMEAWPNMMGSSIYWFIQNQWPLMNMNHVGLYAHSVPDPILGYPEVMIIPALQRSLIVDAHGNRLFNEEMVQSLALGALYLEQGPFYAIFDQPLWSGTTMRGMGYNYDPPLEITATEYAQYTSVLMADDIRDLATQLNIRPDAFGNTIAQYNGFFTEEIDPLGKDLSQTFPIQSSPFYALPIVLSSAKSFGGAKLSSNHHIPNHPNIYVVGESAGFLGTSAIGWGFSGSISSCYYFGKKTAETIYVSLSNETSAD